jgi:hypothetical protein
MLQIRTFTGMLRHNYKGYSDVALTVSFTLRQTARFPLTQSGMSSMPQRRLVRVALHWE